ncbi:two component transcriptional regulator, AraC family [Caloramator quimbayensis]|uniref:Stage 0 sporulation protein A homolog n=1 Tax=Caloramator quimbayensis TaxID=1147123 RepID=A0A1T4WFJ9_9CLOT|nr:response regulator [Caloramator quimbayensis]SKA75929.1 two component transcriptional regulator, AraC family [Caloramator quimbayensis]
MSVVLIVEDEILEQEFLKSIISKEVLPEDSVLTCESGVEAIKLSKQYHPDIILMDIMIPELDGIRTIENIRKFLPDACISVLSASSDFCYAQKAISLKVFEYLLKPIKPNDLKQLLKQMLEITLKRNTLTQSNPFVSNIDLKEPCSNSISESIEYIKEHFREKITLQTVASHAFFNPKYFSHIFKKEMGVSFSEYIINLRIQYACKLLESTNYPAYRISLECGFSDPSYFNRVFCKQMKMTPQAYRKHIRKSIQRCY